MDDKVLVIGYLGDGPWAHNAFDLLLNDETIKIAFVTVRYDSRDKWLIEAAKRENIPVELSDNINGAEYIKMVKEYGVDLLVSMSFNQIFKKELIDTPPLKAINCHAGKLPFYRGRNILNWALINDEKEFGITVHYIDEGIDTGDIILQDVYSITDEDDYRTLLEKAYIGCADILYRSVKLIQNDSVNRIKQNSIDAYGTYCGQRIVGDEIINWDATSRDVFNFVRAICIPGPRATTFIDGNQVKINRVKYIKELRKYVGIPGQIIGKTKEGFWVKTRDTAVIILDYETNIKLRVGERFSRK